jgi:hypothetical protein
MITLFVHLFRKPKNYLSLLIGSFFVFVIFRIIPVYRIIKNSFKIPELSISRKIEIFFDYTFVSFTQVPLQEQIIIIILSVLTMINIILFVMYSLRQRKILSKRSFFSSISGMFLGLFGVGCLSCGVLIMAPLLTFIGLGSYLGNFSQYALTFTYAGLFLLLISTLSLLHQLKKPLVC